MSKLLTLSEELDRAAALLETNAYRDGLTGDPLYPRAVNILRAKAAALRNKGKSKPKRKTVVGYVGSHHTKIKVQGIFEEANKDE